MDQAKIERVLQIMICLTNNHYMTVEDLSKRLETSTRTIYRYIETLKSVGFLVEKRGNIYRIRKNSPYFKDISQLVHFTEEEAYILKSAIESIDNNNLLKQNLKKKLYSVYDFKLVADVVVRPQHRDNVQNLLTAIEEKRTVRLCNYHSAHSNSVSTRLVEPFAFTTNYIQIWCYEIESKKVKMFKISRIGSVEVLEQPWQFQNQHRQDYVDIFRINSSERHPIKLRLTVRAANLLQEEYPLSTQYLTREGEGSWILTTEVCNFEGVGRFILGLFHDVEILQSEDLKSFIRSRIENMRL